MNPLGPNNPSTFTNIGRAFTQLAAAVRDLFKGAYTAVARWLSGVPSQAVSETEMARRTAVSASAQPDPRSPPVLDGSEFARGDSKASTPSSRDKPVSFFASPSSASSAATAGAGVGREGSKAEVQFSGHEHLEAHDFEPSAADVSEPSSHGTLDSPTKAPVTSPQSPSGREGIKHATSEPSDAIAPGHRYAVRAALHDLGRWLEKNGSGVPGQRYRIFTGPDQTSIARVVRQNVSGELRQLLSELTAPKRPKGEPTAPTPQALVTALLQVGDDGRTRLARLLGDAPITLANAVYKDLSRLSARDGTELWAVNNLIFVNGVAGEIVNLVNKEADATQRAAIENTMRVLTDVFRLALCAVRDPKVSVPPGCEVAVSRLRPELDRLIGIPAA
jgi:hypothetical protein